MPEDEEKLRRLNRLLFRERLRSLVLPAALLLPIVAFVLAVSLPEQDVGQAEYATVVSTALQARDDAPTRAINVRLQDGSLAVVSARPLVSPSPGEEICVVRVRQRLVGRISVRLAGPGACDPM